MTGRTILITGAASGMGREMVRLFAADGANVVAVDLNETRLEKLRHEHPGVTTVRADISSTAGVDAAIEATGERIDVLCNNAGISDGAALLDETSEATYDRVLAVNLKGAFLLSQRVVRVMLEHGGGQIITTASIGGYRGGLAGASYTASKFGVLGLSLNIAATYGDQGIRCNVICPGATATNIGESADYTSRGGALIADIAADRLPPSAIASLALFLASDAARDINGAVVPVDRGWALTH
jgi:NAD(P)-dependent dehydrogenase (short-subunit alcohol dehydrogenase family)